MKKLTFVFTIMLVLGLVIGAFALSSSSAVVTKADCCCKDSCPLKSKDSAGKEHASCDCSCCGDSCPMKSKDKTASSNTGDKKDCCEGKESCPMKHNKEKS